jgi:protein-tyrosine phosphatase
MKAQVFWTKEKHPGQIALVPRPRGGDWLEDEAAAWSDAGLDVIVSMLDGDETQSFDLGREGEFCEANGIEFISFPVTDRSVPELNQTLYRLIERLKTSLSKGKNVAIHCRQSIGRAPLLAAILMILYGIEPDEAFRQLSLVRGIEVPETDEQKQWVEKFTEEFVSVLT